MNHKLIKSTEIYWCRQHDRYIYIVKENDDVIGLNYMQGEDFEYFEKDYMNIDYDLTDFYNALADYLNGEDEIERINQAMWAYHGYEILQADRASEKIRREKLKALQDKHDQ